MRYEDKRERERTEKLYREADGLIAARLASRTEEELWAEIFSFSLFAPIGRRETEEALSA